MESLSNLKDKKVSEANNEGEGSGQSVDDSARYKELQHRLQEKVEKEKLDKAEWKREKREYEQEISKMQETQSAMEKQVICILFL